MPIRKSDLMFDFLPGVVEVVLIGLIHAAGKHEVVPQQDAVLVGQLIKIVGLVNPTCYIMHQQLFRV